MWERFLRNQFLSTTDFMTGISTVCPASVKTDNRFSLVSRALFPIYIISKIPLSLGTNATRCYGNGSCDNTLGTPFMDYKLYKNVSYITLIHVLTTPIILPLSRLEHTLCLSYSTKVGDPFSVYKSSLFSYLTHARECVRIGLVSFEPSDHGG